MTDYDEYFEHLKQRKRAGLWYRNLWLYPRIRRHLKGTVLDIGCGIGDLVRHRPDTIGVDVNPKAVAFCRSQGLRVQLMEPDRLPFRDREFDGAVLDNVLEHLERPEPLLAEVLRVLKSGGNFVVGVPGKRGFDSDPDHKRHYPQAALVQAIQSAGFELSRLFHQPFRSRLLDRHFRYYAIYAVFRRPG
jgi:SAM-dependent methyltransferase